MIAVNQNGKLSREEQSKLDCTPGRPYIVPNRSANPLETFYQLPMREYQAVLLARKLLGQKMGDTIAHAMEGQREKFLELDETELGIVCEFFNNQRISFAP